MRKKAYLKVKYFAGKTLVSIKDSIFIVPATLFISTAFHSIEHRR
jgi:hypothetical protein